MNKGLKLFLRLLLIIGGTVLGIFVFFNSILYIAPFLIAFALSSLVEPLIKFLIKKVRLNRKIATVFSLLLVLVIVGGLLALLISRIYQEALSLYDMMPQYSIEIYNNIRNYINKASDIYFKLPQEVTKNAEGMIADLTSTLSGIGSRFAKGVFNTAISIPQAIIFVIVTILSTYFMAADREKIYNYIKFNVPESWVDNVVSIKNDMFAALFGYIRAQLILMSITFVELSIGFGIIGVRQNLLLGLLVSIIDALPILGTGGVLIPWSIYNFITGDIRMGISLIILYGVVLVVRQMIEPKVLGQQIGLHPLVTLLSMYVGLRVFSFIGMIIGPITILLLKNILQGIFKKKSFKEYVKECKSS
ncbi:sporulation integral membrane protein YtvI [Acetivibrio cellulolyticus]|uniref:sporulation integral membrane protein YtvI n=1 Tax=Acetivibrio cellulolyticus TaxID=35830 RepID=UPI0001E2D455|nr:sporulation integral membrane protein YtvI [Acetivibrio cellulolyticus]